MSAVYGNIDRTVIPRNEFFEKCYGSRYTGMFVGEYEYGYCSRK